MANILDNELLKLARNYNGQNQKDFAKQLNITQSVLSNIESGVKPLTAEIAEKLRFEFGKNFFNQRLQQTELKAYYRASATVAKKYTDLFESRLQIIANNISNLLERVNIPENRIPCKDLEDFENDPEYLAEQMRQYFNLGKRPIENIVELLEKHGVIIHFFDYDFISAQNKSFDGVSFYVQGVPVILINSKIQNARKVFTLCHELCHLICHNHSEIFISKFRDIEKEANQFASEFIAPKQLLKMDFYNLNLDKLFHLKAYWKISVGALLYKAKETVLSIDQYRRWVTAISHFRKFEPHDFQISKPILLSAMFKVCEEDLDFDENFYDVLGISEKLFNEIYWERNTGVSRKKANLVI